MRELVTGSRTAMVVGSALIIATLVSWWLGLHDGDPADGASIATIAVLIIAFVKVRLVGRYFMEIRDAPLILRLFFDVYVVAVCTALCVIYAVTS